ncbi:MAG: dienelactone hydrolase family protein [Chroococcidiopsidaceae cyanobacterium CP_BM_RX_35]|nr:dienelactone hydrolase family protein [Chroococcidiopsidaceae cyanobacterium CP_BM_RX_35]
MADREIYTENIQVPNGKLQIAAHLASPQRSAGATSGGALSPEGAGSYPAIVVFQEIFGVNNHIREVTERIARAGYVAIAPAIFQRQAPGFTTGYTPQDIEIGRGYAQQTKASEILGDTQATIDYLKQLPQVQKEAIGCIGFCFGGHVAYLAATLPDIKATASFYGAGIATRTPGGGAPTVTRTPEISGTLYAFFGMEDASIPAEQVDQIEAELEKNQIPHQVFRYDKADHGFFCDQRASYNPEAAADAWEHVKQLFGGELTKK